MKKVIYQKMYDCLSALPDRFNSRLLIKLKVMLGTALLVLAGSCSNDPDEPEVTCYITISPEDTVKVQSLSQPDAQVNMTQIDMGEETL